MSRGQHDTCYGEHLFLDVVLYIGRFTANEIYHHYCVKVGLCMFP